MPGTFSGQLSAPLPPLMTPQPSSGPSHDPSDKLISISNSRPHYQRLYARALAAGKKILGSIFGGERGKRSCTPKFGSDWIASRRSIWSVKASLEGTTRSRTLILCFPSCFHKNSKMENFFRLGTSARHQVPIVQERNSGPSVCILSILIWNDRV